MKQIFFVAATILTACNFAIGQGENSQSEDNILKRAQTISAATGRPIFAVAGSST